MTGESRYESAKRIFLEACEHSLDARSEFILRACEGDDTLRSEVERLFDHDIASSLFGSEDDKEVHPESIDGFLLIRRIGRGGMGEVWEAEQLQPVRRRVALKLIRTGIAGRVVTARFEAERQALALMNHPNITTVFDAGCTLDGQPFFAMELVEGIPITDYCDAKRMSVEVRLRLFLQVCDAVNHAHQKGVIHRDLKPSNILVTEQSGTPLPKVIDFGVSKAICADLSESRLITEQGQWLGTPEYMSPEQAGLTENGVDTRTDVYALGVLLYELLVGTQPFDAEALRSAGFAEMCRVLREEEPPRPSTRVSTLGDRSETVAQHRGTSGVVLSRQLRGELDCVVLKALEKDPDRRYDSPQGFATDVKRFLANEPVLARPPSHAYRLRKFVARNRLVVAALAAGMVVLIAGIVGTTSAMVKARRDAEAARRVTEALTAIVQSLNPGAQSRSLKNSRTALDRCVAEIEDQLHAQPKLRGQLLKVMGQTYTGLAAYDKGGQLLDEALVLWTEEFGDDHPALCDLYMSLGDNRYRGARIGAARQAFERALVVCEGDTVQVSWALQGLGRCFWRDADYGASREMLDRALEVIESDHSVCSSCYASVLHMKGLLLISTGHPAEAKPLFEQAVSIYEEDFGSTHSVVAAPVAHLAMVLSRLGDLEGAEIHALRALEIQKATLGDDHHVLAFPLRELGAIEIRRGNPDEGRRLIEEALEIEENALGVDHPDLIWTLRIYASSFTLSGDFDAALKVYDRALSIAENAFGPVHAEVAATLESKAIMEVRRDQFAAAHQLMKEAQEIRLQVLPATDTLIGINYYNQACVAALDGDRRAAIGLLTQALSTEWVDAIIFRDPDLDSLRDDPEFQSILTQVRARLDS